jgi:[glutamine synthetase] adenylyltransferase / [glutamine synthetase]-adenylyl-L-tyrosine phosphorylase
VSHAPLLSLTRFEATPQTHAGQRIVETWQEGDDAARALHASVTTTPALRGFIDFIGTHSGYLARLLELHPDVMAAFLRGEADPFCCDIIHTILSRQTEDIKPELARAYVRQMKQRISLMIALADISELWTLEQITHTLSCFAEACVQYALEQIYRHAVPKTQVTSDLPLSPHSGIVLLGMGKLGGRELNYSSDIDLIALYDPTKLDFLAPPAHSRFVIRIIQQLASFLQDRQEHGYVFRVDLRLRPDPASTGLAVSLETAIRYYEQVGQNWERAAMIKARPIAGDLSVGEHFLRVLQPFIWRNHLDFAAIEDILSIKRQMQAKEEPEIALTSHNLKTGYGGIREIEFLAQIHQLIWGGRIRELRTRATCEVLHLLTKHGLIDSEVNALLQESYRIYRTIEHRLQMRQDQQTHTMPDDTDGCERLAAFCLPTPDDASSGDLHHHFLSSLLTRLRQVHDVFKHAFQDSSPLGNEGKLVFTGVDHDPETLTTIRAMGFDEAEAISFAIQQWHKGTKRCTRTKRARELLTELVPLILEELARTVDPDQAFRRFDSFLDALPAGVQPFSLFYSNRELLTLIADIAGNAPVMAKTLSSYPQLLDLLVNHQADRMPKEFADMQRTLDDWLSLARSDEERVTNYCMFQLEQEFMIGVLLLRQQISAQTASRYLSHLADTMICAAVKLVCDQLNLKYQMQPELHFAVIALGKLGTQELMIGSDLDVMFLYDIPSSADLSDEESLSLHQYYNRLTARVINLLSHPSKMGALYEMDTKLRPYGAQGAVAVRLDGFTDYYASAAWIVENLALLQARIVYASDAMQQPAADALARAQTIPESSAKISKNIHEIRKKISEQHYSSNAWDIKYVWGGMMDLQWILKGLLAKHSVQHPLPEHFSDTVGHIHWLQQIRAIDANQQQMLLEAHRVFHTVLSYLRLCHGNALKEEQITDGLKQVLTEVTGMKNYKSLKQHLLRLQAQIYHMYQNLSYL